MKIYNSNELKYQEEIKEKYSIDKIFENRKRNKEETNKDSEYINEKEENVALIEFKENIFLKIIKKIKSLFKKKK